VEDTEVIVLDQRGFTVFDLAGIGDLSSA